MKAAVKSAVLWLLAGYKRWVSPLLPPSCRFVPTCSEYARLAVDGGAAIVGGCCGTSPDHLRAMRVALDAHTAGDPPTLESIVEHVGPLANAAPNESAVPTRGRGGRSRPARA